MVQNAHGQGGDSQGRPFNQLEKQSLKVFETPDVLFLRIEEIVDFSMDDSAPIESYPVLRGVGDILNPDPALPDAAKIAIVLDPDAQQAQIWKGGTTASSEVTRMSQNSIPPRHQPTSVPDAKPANKKRKVFTNDNSEDEHDDSDQEKLVSAFVV
jgi:hypothetical protein